MFETLDALLLAGPVDSFAELSLASCFKRQWPRLRARTSDDHQYVYHPTPAVNGGSICVGYPYSLLDWVPMSHTSWSLTVNVQRIPSTMTARDVGVQQVKALS